MASLPVMDGTKADDAKPVVHEARPAATSFTAVNKSSNNKPVDAAPEVNDDDEQVERFYALLANIRAMRTGRTRKRPWRPVFRLEDFEDDNATATSRWARKKERSQLPDGGEEGDGSVVTSPPPPPPPPRVGGGRAGSNSNSI